MARERLYNLDPSQLSNRRNLELLVDESSLPEAQKLPLSNILSKTVVAGQSADDDTVAVTPYALTRTTATTSRAGIIETATDTEAETGTATDKALTPSNISSMFSNVFKITKNYSSGDFDAASSNYDSLTLSYFNESEVGSQVWHNGSFRLTNASQVTDFNVFLDVINDNLPSNGVAFSVRWRNDNGGNAVYQPVIGFAQTSNGQLLLKFSNGTNGFPAKTTSPDVWDFKFTYTFYK